MLCRKISGYTPIITSPRINGTKIQISRRFKSANSVEYIAKHGGILDIDNIKNDSYDYILILRAAHEISESLKDKDKLEFLNSRIGFHKPWAPTSLYLDSIQHSITESEKLKIKYQSKKEEQITERTIQPCAVYFSGAVWTTIAFCELRQEIREFRLDRIKELKLQQTHFKPDKTFSIEHYLEERSKRLFLNP